MNRTILHIDMDAFFASVEQRDNPRLRNRPVAITGSSARTVIVSPSYEARSFGVRTGMTRRQAKLLCADIVFVSGNSDKYASICGRIVKILYAFTPDIEIASIDEFFLDITGTMHLFGTAGNVAADAREAIKNQLGLNCSIGISHNKLLAKFASEKAKPGGIYRLGKEDVASVFNDTKVDKLCGIGAKTFNTLSLMGINTLGELRSCSIARLKSKFGVNGRLLSLMAHGIDDSAIVPFYAEEEAKSMGHSMTFNNDTSDFKVLSHYLFGLADMVGRRLRKAGLCAATIKLTIRYKSFKTFTRQRAIVSPTDDTKDIYYTARSILEGVTLKEPVRLLGITGCRLSAYSEGISLFLKDIKKKNINRVLDHINERFNSSAISFASLLKEDKRSKVISPAWRPSGNRNY